MLSLSKYPKAHRLLIACALLFNNVLSSQANLIKNGSFEHFNNQHNASVEGKFETYNPGYVKIVNDWEQINSADHFDSAYTVYDVPHARFGNSYAKSGEAFAGIMLFYGYNSLETKEHVYQQLLTPLKQDSVYCFSMFVTLADASPLAVKNIGASFTVGAPNTSVWYVSATPQVANTSGFVTDTVNWTEIKGCFTAQGGEDHVTIGNFYSNANTDTLGVYPVSPLTGPGSHIAYYYVDSVTLYRNNFPTGINELGDEHDFSVYPNPAKDILHVGLIGLYDKEKLNVRITDIIGREALSSDYKEQLDISNLDDGIYIITILNNQNSIITKKFIKESR